MHFYRNLLFIIALLSSIGMTQLHAYCIYYGHGKNNKPVTVYIYKSKTDYHRALRMSEQEVNFDKIINFGGKLEDTLGKAFQTVGAAVVQGFSMTNWIGKGIHSLANKIMTISTHDLDAGATTGNCWNWEDIRDDKFNGNANRDTQVYMLVIQDEAIKAGGALPIGGYAKMNFEKNDTDLRLKIYSHNGNKKYDSN